MFKIESELFTFISYKQEEDNYSLIGPSKKRGGVYNNVEFASVAKIRKSLGYPIKSYAELVNCVAEIGYKNNGYNLLFRGQEKDYKNSKDMTILYPSIYRPDKGKQKITSKIIEKRFEKLENSINILREKTWEISWDRGLSAFKEYQIALLQHYELELTPFLDLTNSLLVAASFSLQKSDEGFVYVLGMPHTYGSISLFVDHNMRIVNLQNVCPPEASRPHFQNGFLVGRLPYSKKKEANDNFAYRLIAKIKCINTDGKFWNKGFGKIPKEILLPPNDKFEFKLKNLLKME